LPDISEVLCRERVVEIEVVSLSLPDVLLLPSTYLVGGLLPSPGEMLGHVKRAVFVNGGQQDLIDPDLVLLCTQVGGASGAFFVKAWKEDKYAIRVSVKRRAEAKMWGFMKHAALD
jgi:hypothetical protein